MGGHLLATAVGIAVGQVAGDVWWALALAVGLAIAGMALTRTLHAPAGADPIVAILGGASWPYLVQPVLAGSLAIVVVAAVYNSLFRDRQYPQYWL